MSHAHNNQTSIEPAAHRVRLAGALTGALVLLSLLLAAPALANLEHVAAFAPRGEYGTAWQGWMYDKASAAVNTTGAGGVPKGTLYAVTNDNRLSSVARFDPDGEFREAWGWGVARSEEEKDAQEIKSEEERVALEGVNAWPLEREKEPSVEFQRCGPDGESAHPQCATQQGEGGQDAGVGEGDGITGEGVGQLFDNEAVAVDQTTGYVYVLTNRKHGVIQVYSADGSRLIASFGELGKGSGEHIAESPEKVHGTNQGGLAVNAAGEVYVYDEAYVSNELQEFRAMVFRPHEGDYEDYEYAGRASDIAVPGGASRFSLDDAGNLYVTGFGSNKIEEFSPAHPTAPICTSGKLIKGSAITAGTVDPVTGEPFYYNSKTETFHRLSVCNSEGVFVQVAEFPAVQVPKEVSPGSEEFEVQALVFNPAVSWSASRPHGVLYAMFSQAGGFRSGQASGEIYAEAEIAFPSVVSESASSVAETTARLHAEINPRGFQTSYDFQYLTRAEYEANPSSERFAGATELPAGGASLGSGSQPVPTEVSVAGLSPETEYRYRVVAVSDCDPAEVCETFGESLAFRTYPPQTQGLADGRAYELVSPVDKYGGEVFPLKPEQEGQRCKSCIPGNGSGVAFPTQAAPDGESIVYQGDQPFTPTGGRPNGNEYLARRTASGWQTTNLTPELLNSNYGRYAAFDSGLDSGLISLTDLGSPVLAPEAPAGYADLYLQGSADPLGLSPVLRAAPPNRAPAHLKVRFDGGNLDYTHLLFEANDALTGPTVFAPGAVDGGESKFNLYESVGGGLRLVNVLPNGTTVPGAVLGRFGASPDYSHAVSDDGSRVFWSGESGRVYVREDGEQTVEIHNPGAFLTASVSGSRVLLADGCLYPLEAEKSLEGETCVDLTKGEGGFQGIAGASEDLSRVYFVDTAVLTGGEENEYGAKAQTGKDNLYAWDEGATSFVATLGAEAGDWAASPSERDAEASPDGGWLVFYSSASLTGYENDGPACVRGKNDGEFSAGACSEAFVFDAATGRLVCASCNPSGVAPLGTTPPILPRAPSPSEPQPRYLTDSGRVVFDTQDSLVPADTNEGAEDVYEWEPDGVGSCRSSFASGGCVNLISAGSETDDSQFFAMDESGKNVFFTTRDRLVRSDTDELYDLYDAREAGGGFASETETLGQECQGEACQSTPVPPVFGTPGSTTFSGAGNLVSALPAAASGTPKPKTTVKRASTGKLAKELRACRRKHAKRKRLACEQKARKQARKASRTAAARRASTNKHSGVGR